MQTNEAKDFGSLDAGDLFVFQSRVYCKRDFRTAVVICADGETRSEHDAKHTFYFYPEELIDLYESIPEE